MVMKLIRGKNTQAAPLKSGGNGADPSGVQRPQGKAGAGGNHQGQAAELEKLTRQVAGQGQALLRVIDHLQNQGQQQEPLMTLRERRDLFQVLSDPPDELLPQFTDVSRMMATMIPAMDVIRWNLTPRTERPIHPQTRRPYGLYLLWEMSYARWNLSVGAHNAIRMSDVVQARGPDQNTRLGVVAE